jgi:hypothetical protein
LGGNCSGASGLAIFYPLAVMGGAVGLLESRSVFKWGGEELII